MEGGGDDEMVARKKGWKEEEEEGRERKLQAHYVQGEWRVSYFATLVIVCHAKGKCMGVSITPSIGVSASLRVEMCVCAWGECED